MKRRKFLRKTVAGALVFVMCSTNTMYVAKNAFVYASQELDIESHTNVKDVDANILLVNNGQKAKNIVADVSKSDQKLVGTISMKREGYIQKGEIEIVGQNSRVFSIENPNNNSVIEKVEGNKITLNRFSGTTVNFELPLKYVYEGNISKDILSFQLVSDTCKVLRPKKYKGVDSSYIVDIYNIWNVLINNIRHIRSEEIVSSSINLHPGLFTNVLAMSGVPERHIVSLTSTSHVLKSLLNNTIDINSVGYNQSSLNKILDIVNKGVLENLSNDIEDRWKSVNADFQCETIRNNPIYSQLVLKDYDDTAALMRLVSKYFDKLPLHLS